MRKAKWNSLVTSYPLARQKCLSEKRRSELPGLLALSSLSRLPLNHPAKCGVPGLPWEEGPRAPPAQSGHFI